ncbi:hypothetical protein BLOT_006866 [Blomia tropicalis]|nr:hypothetical protein BLOT_006866 [Blomia tropicalis]
MLIVLEIGSRDCIQTHSGTSLPLPRKKWTKSIMLSALVYMEVVSKSRKLLSIKINNPEPTLST